MADHTGTVKIELSVLVRKEGDQYVSWCPEFDVASCGDTIEDASENLHDAIDSYLDALCEEKEMVQVLNERGFVLTEKHEIESCERPFISTTSVSIPITP